MTVFLSIEWNMIVVTFSFLILNQTESHLVPKIDTETVSCAGKTISTAFAAHRKGFSVQFEWNIIMGYDRVDSFPFNSNGI